MEQRLVTEGSGCVSLSSRAKPDLLMGNRERSKICFQIQRKMTYPRFTISNDIKQGEMEEQVSFKRRQVIFSTTENALV